MAPVTSQTNWLSVYPFIQAVPFPSGLIKNIKLAIKPAAVVYGLPIPFVSAVQIKNRTMQVQIATDQLVLGTFQLENTTFDCIDNNLVYGFVQLSVPPSIQCSFRGKFKLHNSCYTYPVQLGGLQHLKINNQVYQAPTILTIRVTGDAAVSVSDSIVISRTDDPLYTYFDKSAPTQSVVTSVDGIQCGALQISTAFSSVNISDVVQGQNGRYIIFIDTTNEFPTCDRQADVQE